MKYFMLSALLIIGVSCASNHEQHGPHQPDSREVASASSPKCEIVKHSSKDWFRVEKEGVPFSKFWYSKNNADKRFSEHVGHGHCSQN